jgi:membrane protein YqaA with SNARE-associated domain
MLLLCTFLVSIVSAMCPLVNIEVYIAGIGALGNNFGVFPMALAAGIGATIGKLIWYAVGASSMRWPFIARKMEAPNFQKAFARVQAQIDRRAWMGMALLFLSSTIGLPPLAIMSVLCGQLRFNRVAFGATVLVGRVLRFAVVLGGSAWLVS